MMLRNLIAPTLMLAALTACDGTSLVAKFKDYQARGETVAARGLAEIVVYRCSLMSAEERKNLAAAMNAELAGAHRVSALDCDADGVPDFVLDETDRSPKG